MPLVESLRSSVGGGVYFGFCSRPRATARVPRMRYCTLRCVSWFGSVFCAYPSRPSPHSCVDHTVASVTDASCRAETTADATRTARSTTSPSTLPEWRATSELGCTSAQRRRSSPRSTTWPPSERRIELNSFPRQRTSAKRRPRIFSRASWCPDSSRTEHASRPSQPTTRPPTTWNEWCVFPVAHHGPFVPKCTRRTAST